jgi:subtilisin family serine protease
MEMVQMRSKKVLSYLSISMALLMVLAAFAVIPGTASTATEKRVIVVFNDTVDEKVIKENGGKVVKRLSSIPALVVTIGSDKIDDLEKVGKVKTVEIDQQASIAKPRKRPPAPPADTPPAPELQWGVDRIDAEAVWDVEGKTAGDGIVVAILDTGIMYDHPELGAAMWTNTGETDGNGIDDDDNGYIDDYYGYDFINDDGDPKDDNGHGTHCAGITAAARGDLTGFDHDGVVGVAYDVKLMAVKVLDSGGSGSYSDIADGIRYAADNGADVISMSLSGRSGSDTLRDAIRYAIDKNGVVVVAAAGNSGKRSARADTVQYPARYPEVIAVGATESDDDRATFSATGTGLDIVAPGVGVWSTYNDGTWRSFSGTSMACPHVAGTVALVLANSADPLTPYEMHSWLNQTAEHLGDDGWDSLYGYGIVDAENAVT